MTEILRVEGGPAVRARSQAPIPFPNAGSPVKPVPGTRPEYTPVADHYRVDIDLDAADIDASLAAASLGWSPTLTLTLDQLKTRLQVDGPVRHAVVHLEPGRRAAHRDHAVERPAVSRRPGDGRRQPQARYAHMLAEDGFDEVVDLAMVESDPRIMLAYAWNGQPLPADHGFPLRIYMPDLYGMKQPKWITDIVLVPDFIQATG